MANIASSVGSSGRGMLDGICHDSFRPFFLTGQCLYNSLGEKLLNRRQTFFHAQRLDEFVLRHNGEAGNIKRALPPPKPNATVTNCCSISTMR